MSERTNETQTPSKKLRIRGLLERMGVARQTSAETALAAAAIAGTEDPEAAIRARFAAHEKPLPAGPGLKASQLDAKQFRYSTDQSQLESRVPQFKDTFRNVLAKYHETTPKHPGTEGDDAFAKAMHSAEVQSSTTPKLQEWVKEHTPQNGYFTPEMVAEAVAENPNVQVGQKDTDGIRTWSFSDTSGKNSISLSRTVDGSRPEVETRPYLAVGYRPEYDFDTEEVVAKPRLWINGLREGEYGMLQSTLGHEIMTSLQVPEPRTHQPLDFHIVEAQARPYLTDASVSSLESVVTEAHVVADLPHPEQTVA